MELALSGGNTRQNLVRGTKAALALHVAAILFLVFGQLPTAGHTLIRDLLILVLPLLTLPLAFRVHNSFSKILASISAAGVVGQIVWIVERYGFERSAEPSLAMIPWAVGYGLVIVAVTKWPARTEHQASVRSLLDGVMIAAGFFAVLWAYVVGPQIVSSGKSPLQFLFEIIFVAIDVAVIVAVLQAVRRGVDPRFQMSTRYAVGGLVALAVSDVGALWHGAHWVLTDITTLSWPIGTTCANLAAVAFGIEHARVGHPSVHRPRGSKWRLGMPCLALVPVAAVLLHVTIDPNLRHFELGVKLSALVLTIALGARQLLALADNDRLLEELQVAQKELVAKNEEVSQTNDDLTDVLGRLTEKNRELALANEQLARLVTVDGMTGLGNHRAFHERLRLEVDAARRFKHPLTVIIADIDHFRRYNDEYGHPAGDEVLRHVAKTLFDEIDLKAYPARYGGEEFAIVLPYVGIAEATEVAKRIGTSMAGRLRLKRPITLSFGIAGIEGNQWTAELLVQESFRALEAAKTRGRNQIVLADDLDRRCLSLSAGDSPLSIFDPTEPMGLAAILSAGLRSHPQALSIEPDIQLVSGLLGTLELKDLETRDHSERVMWYALRLAQSVMETRAARMTQEDLRSLAYGALLHDIGKIGVPEQILKFAGPLDEEMRRVINEHPRHGALLVQKFPSLELALPVVRYHHERWNGTGYPSGMRGKEIPLVARIFAVVDSLEALTSQRPYKDPIPIEGVTEILVRDSGTHFDPALIEAYLAVPMAEWTRLREQERDVAARSSSREALHLPPL